MNIDKLERKTLYPNGVVRSGILISRIPGKETRVFYRDDGTIEKQVEYLNGRKHGFEKIYNSRGKLQNAIRYENGERADDDDDDDNFYGRRSRSRSISDDEDEDEDEDDDIYQTVIETNQGQDSFALPEKRELVLINGNAFVVQEENQKKGYATSTIKKLVPYVKPEMKRIETYIDMKSFDEALNFDDVFNFSDLEDALKDVPDVMKIYHHNNVFFFTLNDIEEFNHKRTPMTFIDIAGRKHVFPIIHLPSLNQLIIAPIPVKEGNMVLQFNGTYNKQNDGSVCSLYTVEPK
jgi:hypothetical protein